MDVYPYMIKEITRRTVNIAGKSIPLLWVIAIGLAAAAGTVLTVLFTTYYYVWVREVPTVYISPSYISMDVVALNPVKVEHTISSTDPVNATIYWIVCKREWIYNETSGVYEEVEYPVNASVYELHVLYQGAEIQNGTTVTIPAGKSILTTIHIPKEVGNFYVELWAERAS